MTSGSPCFTPSRACFGLITLFACGSVEQPAPLAAHSASHATPHGSVTNGSATNGSTPSDSTASSASALALSTAFATQSADGSVLTVGVVIPVRSFEQVPSDDPAFQSNVGLEMPEQVRDAVFTQLLRINWLASGHGPGPYGKPHFDLHFYRGSKSEISAISCASTESFPASILAQGYEPADTCVAGMGYHAWPSHDIEAHSFDASIILGYSEAKMVFIEPMITQERLLERSSFELVIARPSSAGGATTLYPSLLRAEFDPQMDAYRFEFSGFSPID